MLKLIEMEAVVDCQYDEFVIFYCGCENFLFGLCRLQTSLKCISVTGEQGHIFVEHLY